MDSALETNILTLISTEITYFIGDTSAWSLAYLNGTAAKVQAAQLLGYAGAAVAFFFSVSGALQAGAKIIYYLEKSFWSFLYDFQKKDKYITMLEDEESGKKFRSFMESYALDTAVLMLVAFWHVFFVMFMGVISSFLLFFTVNTYSNTADVDINSGFKIFVIGALVGSTNLLAAKALSVN